MATDTLAHNAHAHEHGHHDTGPMKLAIAIHQICQIMAKPNTVAKAAMTMPAPLFFGI